MDARVKWLSGVPLEKKVADRWCSFGPYYAMFPVSFARRVIATYTEPGDLVLDPFCGRGTAVFCAAEAGRNGHGVEINPVGWLYARVKLNPARRESVEAKLVRLGRSTSRHSKEIDKLPKFFRKCFSREVLAFLIACRRNLDWRSNAVDATLMAFVILHLHGRIASNGRPQALSNQMRQTKSMSQQYSLRWWKDNGYDKPPTVDPVKFLIERIRWRYKKGVPKFSDSTVKLGDAARVVSRMAGTFEGKFQLLFTSPPYSAVTSYYFDQWLRLWMLGGPAVPSRAGSRWKSRFENKAEYRLLIETVFQKCAPLMSHDAVIYVRTDARKFTRDVTIEALRKAFPNRHPVVRRRPFRGGTQTALFGDTSKKPGELDIILLPNS